ncbi:hypothetical protein GX411_07095 [Candidatus Fermentibacteria bacterium]|nr:hypothetical protein [Candidatus Fermentibacteria bacterium]
MSENKARVAALVRQARDEMRAGNRDEALNLLKKAISMDPGSTAVTEAVIEIEKEMAAAAASAGPQKQEAPVKSSVQAKPAPQPTPAQKAPEVKPQPTPAQKAPEAKPQPTPAQKAPEAKPQPTPAQKAPEVKPQPTPAQKAPEAKPQPATARPVPGERPEKTVRAGGGTAVAPPQSPPSASREDLLKALFASSDKAMAAGDEAGAITALRKARELAPDSQEAVSRLRNLQKLLKARTLVGVARRKLSEGAPAEALAKLKEAFELWPATEGLGALLDALEAEAARMEKTAKPASKPSGEKQGDEVGTEPRPHPEAGRPVQAEKTPRPVQPAPRRVPQRSASLSADDYVRRVREQIQMSAFPAAAEIAAEGLARFPDNVLLKTFVEKFSRMGLLPK